MLTPASPKKVPYFLLPIAASRASVLAATPLRLAPANSGAGDLAGGNNRLASHTDEMQGSSSRCALSTGQTLDGPTAQRGGKDRQGEAPALGGALAVLRHMSGRSG